MAEKRLNVKEVSKVEYAKIKIKDPNTFYFIKDDVAYIPAADVVEVRHGRWLQTKEPLGYRDVDCVECSACHDSWVLEEDYDIEDYKMYWKYCPNCGAKMDGKDGAE